MISKFFWYANLTIIEIQFYDPKKSTLVTFTVLSRTVYNNWATH